MAPTPLHISGNSPPTASGAAIKKRNLDSPPDYSPKAETDKERELRRKLLLEKMKIKKEAAIYESVTRISPAPSTMTQRIRGSGVLRASPPGSDAVSVAVASDPKKMSYKEKLAMAAKLQDEKRNLGVITHKARAPVMEKKEWQKKLGARKRTENAATSVAMYNKGKYPVILSGCERSGTATAQTLPRREMDNGILVRKPSQSRRFGNSKGKSIHKARPAEVPIKRKRSPSPISWRGRNSAASILKKTNRSHPSRSRYDDADDEDDDWIVDDDEDDDGLRGRAYSKQYTAHCYALLGITR
jgi:protein SPT2